MSAALCHVRATPIGSALLGPAPVQVLVSLTAPNELQLKQRALELAAHRFDIVEWRADGFTDLSASALLSAAAVLRSTLTRPVLWTLRTKAQGGCVTVDAHRYHALVSLMSSSGLIDAVDIELSGQPQTPASVDAAHRAGLPVVMSYHDFTATPSREQIVSLLCTMDAAQADILKVAFYPRSFQDVLTLMQAALDMRAKTDKPLIALSMGPLGTLTRAAPALFGSSASFASIGTPSAPGQIENEELHHLLELFSPE